FAPLDPPSLLWRLASRLALLPVLAGISYELTGTSTPKWVRPAGRTTKKGAGFSTVPFLLLK
ncbi:MAG: hypothetical protein R6U89_02860, partial [Dehalococcoidia bacterium]